MTMRQNIPKHVHHGIMDWTENFAHERNSNSVAATADVTLWKFESWWIQNEGVDPKQAPILFDRRIKNTTVGAVETDLKKKEAQKFVSF